MEARNRRAEKRDWLRADAFEAGLRRLVDRLPNLSEGTVLDGIVLKDRSSTYRDGTRAGWSKVKDQSWYEREAWRFDRR